MDPSENPDSGQGQWSGTPMGGDTDNTTHVQPAPPLPNMGGGLAGEQDDPRFC